jgi:microcystin-dependent protein
MIPSFDRRRFIGRLAAGLAATAWLGRPKPARAATTSTGPYIGEIMLVSWNFPPKGWAFCNGQTLPIAPNTALFSLLGTTYGGDGITTFKLPDLRDRVPIHFGQGAGLSLRSLGERSGETVHTLTLAELPTHAHPVQVSAGSVGTQVDPAGHYPARNPAGYPQYGSVVDVAMAAAAIGSTGGGQSHTNLQPYLGLNFVIALQGFFPSTT